MLRVLCKQINELGMQIHRQNNLETETNNMTSSTLMACCGFSDLKINVIPKNAH